MIKLYPLEWLDSLILQTFNPKKTNVNILTETDLAHIAENVAKESQSIQLQLKKQVFSMRKKRQIRLLIRKYHSTLIFLLNSVVENKNNEALKSKTVSDILDTIVLTLDELLGFVENRFSGYLNLDERIPVTYWIVSQNEILQKLDLLKKKKQEEYIDTRIIKIVTDTLINSLASSIAGKITYRQIMYYKEILSHLEKAEISLEKTGLYSTIDEILIESNFNSSVYINYFTGKILQKLHSQSTINATMNELLLFYKEFCHLHFNEKISFDPTHDNIKHVLGNWFRDEIAYLEKKMTLSPSSTNDPEVQKDSFLEVQDNKIECILSTDQMGLILRATDESRIIKAKSMSQVFKTIIPFLSTPFKKDLSYQSVRSKSYTAEDRDKEVAIQTLEKIINKIKSY
ncbi:hypothetical protein CLU81_5201 [Flavobacterium sp. 9]|uniref:hypothetical protein n=1 Tax=Flavobacterium sp. 9 TaxID=2035198 RepID=UPI000C1A30EC|nr:hypothetical protein [Flavobacterium sp. 9]PIF34545.1 hypothetical protein CLU81_5201 [Flavobacterium sp. 9]